MRRPKQQKWKDNAGRACVHEPAPQHELRAGHVDEKRGRWRAAVFGNDGPLVLELGCGRGEYTVSLARRRPDHNFVGIDIKGHRFWHGAKAAEEEGLPNVAFLRTNVEFVDRFFGPAEVDEIWLPFSDPCPDDERGTKRITSALFLRRYETILRPGGLLHLKTDSELLFESERDDLREAGHPILVASDDVHGKLVHEVPDELRELLEIRTAYEQRWIAEGRRICYVQARVD